MAVVLAGTAVAIAVCMTSSPASAQETIACVSNRLGLVRIVQDESQCKFWEHAQTIGGGDGAGVKLVFVTSESYYGDITPGDDSPSQCPEGTTGIDCARFECNRLAADVNLPGEYEPWLSDSSSDAAGRFGSLGADGPWFNVKGTLVAGTLAGLLTPKNSDYLYNAVNYTELGTVPTDSSNTWTGTGPDGLNTGLDDCNNWSQQNGSQGTIGDFTHTDSAWTSATFNPCTEARHLYCFQR
jgi:hypothetical protein